MQSFEQYSIPQAAVLTVWRLVRCNPLHFPKRGYGVDEPTWPPPVYWAGDGRLRTLLDDERSRERALGEDAGSSFDAAAPTYDPLGIQQQQRGEADEGRRGGQGDKSDGPG